MWHLLSAVAHSLRALNWFNHRSPETAERPESVVIRFFLEERKDAMRLCETRADLDLSEFQIYPQIYPYEVTGKGKLDPQLLSSLAVWVSGRRQRHLLRRCLRQPIYGAESCRKFFPLYWDRLEWRGPRSETVRPPSGMVYSCVVFRCGVLYAEMELLSSQHNEPNSTSSTIDAIQCWDMNAIDLRGVRTWRFRAEIPVS